MRKIEEDGQVFYEVYGHKLSPEEFKRLFALKVESAPTGASFCGWKPIVSDAMAVHPAQVEEAIASAKKLGVPTEFLPDGRPIFSSRSHRKEYLKKYGFHDRQGGYGD